MWPQSAMKVQLVMCMSEVRSGTYLAESQLQTCKSPAGRALSANHACQCATGSTRATFVEDAGAACSCELHLRRLVCQLRHTEMQCSTFAAELTCYLGMGRVHVVLPVSCRVHHSIQVTEGGGKTTHLTHSSKKVSTEQARQGEDISKEHHVLTKFSLRW
ncbi:hypothetical protein FKP32DRAFT_326679 [Trametes sanguinea]|nr:hypothetical protein FKP32DRAFT_326679 [Trametes sanguinea]